MGVGRGSFQCGSGTGYISRSRLYIPNSAEGSNLISYRNRESVMSVRYGLALGGILVSAAPESANLIESSPVGPSLCTLGSQN